ncbi:tubulin polyglutamylase TTLL11 isoform X1 [Tachysurus ichikawai]
MSDHYEKHNVVDQIDARALEDTGHIPVCSRASAPPVPESISEKSCSVVKSKAGTRIVKRSSDLIVNKPRVCASVHLKGARRHALPVKGSGKTETNGGAAEIKAVRKPRSVTVDTSKAKTSLEALKLSVRQLQWKEVREL